MSDKAMTADQFLKDVAGHVMTVHLDNGLYRHLTFRSPGPNSWNLWFEIVTWPGCLTINGDMGSWAFARIDDMFGFFRSTGELKINAGYWQEKILSENRFGGTSEKFDVDTFKAAVLSELDGYELSARTKEAIRIELNDEVFGINEESVARKAMDDFEHYHIPEVTGSPSRAQRFTFSGIWEITAKAYTNRYLWCLYAIVWGIQQYDAAKAGAEAQLPTQEVANA